MKKHQSLAGNFGIHGEADDGKDSPKDINPKIKIRNAK